VDGNDVDVEGIVRQASGIGTRTEGADLTGCGRLPEVDTGKVIGGGISFAFPEVQLGLVVSGTSTSTTCSSTTQSTFLGNLKDGTLRGTAIISNGSITAIDFNRTTNNGNRVTITTGRLSPLTCGWRTRRVLLLAETPFALTRHSIGPRHHAGTG
jgi:hypothetical protein